MPSPPAVLLLALAPIAPPAPAPVPSPAPASPAPSPAAQASQAETAGYAVGPDDVLHVVVLGQEALSGDFAVDGFGQITFPLLGKLRVAGDSPERIEQALTALLLDGYLKRPQVSVSMKEYRSQRIFVTGEVQHPGTYALKADRSILAVLGEVGAFTPDAGHEVVVIRPPKGVPAPEGPALPPGEPGAALEAPGAEIVRVSLRELQQNPEAGLLLAAGDTLYVPRAAQVFITGHVARQGSYRYQEGMTVLEALTLAGGVTERGSRKGVRVIHSADRERKEEKAKLTDRVQPGDTIVVPERFF